MKTITKLSMSEINVRLGKVARSAAITSFRVQQIAEQAVLYSLVAKSDEDIEAATKVAQQLYDVVSGCKSLNKLSLVAYVEKFGNMIWSKTAKGFAYFKNPDIKQDTPEQFAEALDRAASTMWDNVKPQSDPVSIYDMEEQFRKFIGRMEKLASDGNVVIKHKNVLDVISRAFTKTVAEETLKSMKLDDAATEEEVTPEPSHEVELPKIVIAA